MIRLAVRVRREHAEIALAELLAFAPGGVEEVEAGDVVEYAVYGAPGELPELPDLRAAAGDALVEVTTAEVADDWADRWRAFHRPVTVRDRVHVRPPWAPAPEAAGDVIDLVIEPGQAFGTGAHATTRLCLELLLDVPPAGALVDVGCGSGVLAIAAAKLGFAPVVALDHDPLAVEATRANAAANGVEVEVRRWDLRAAPLPPAPTVVANLLRPLLLALVPGVTAAPPRTLIASGLLAHEASEVAAAFAAAGLHEAARSGEGDWAALALRGSGTA